MKYSGEFIALRHQSHSDLNLYRERENKFTFINYLILLSFLKQFTYLKVRIKFEEATLCHV